MGAFCGKGGGDEEGEGEAKVLDAGGGDGAPLRFAFGFFCFGLCSSHQSSAIVPPSSQCTSCRRKDQLPPLFNDDPEAEGEEEE